MCATVEIHFFSFLFLLVIVETFQSIACTDIVACLLLRLDLVSVDENSISAVRYCIYVYCISVHKTKVVQRLLSYSDRSLL